jgi:iron complex transport system ATP-binding protein
MIRVQNISYSAGNTAILKQVSASFEEGQLNLIIGPNGAGKSTLLKIIGGLLRPGSGSVQYGSRQVADFSISGLAAIRAVLSQSIELAFPMLVKEVVMMGRYPHFTGKPGATDRQACEESMAFFNVEAMADRNYASLSEGEKQRVQFARVLAQIWFPVNNACRYLLLDEPLNSLDVYYQFDLLKKLLQLLGQQNLVVVGIVHDLSLAAKFADKVLLLKDGAVLAEGSKQAVFTKENIRTAYRMEASLHYINNELRLDFE